jgi:hypothetical protein
MAHQETDAAQEKDEARQVPRAGHRSRDHVPEYVLYGAYTALAVSVVCCLAFIARSFEDADDSEPKRTEWDR